MVLINISTPEQCFRVQEDRNEPSRQMPTRHESIGEDVENA